MNAQQHIYESLARFSPELILAGGACFVIILSLIAKRNHRLLGIVSLLTVLLSGVAAVMQFGINEPIFFGMVAVDPFAVFFKVFLALATLFILLFSMQSREVRESVNRLGEYYALILIMLFGMNLTVSATNIIMLVLAIEVLGLSSYVLAGFTKEQKDSAEASLKYVIFGAVSSGFMLYGLSWFFGLTGALTYDAMNYGLAFNQFNFIAVLIATVLVLVGFGYKISAVPFHFWTPDVYQGAPITITAFLSVASKAAGFGAMIRFFKTVFIDKDVSDLASGVWYAIQGFEWYNIVIILSVLTMTLGNLVALWQNNMKRLLAYSSIAHAGYMLMGVVVMSDQGIASVMIYFIVYLFMNLGAFYLVMLVADKTGSEDIHDYVGIGYKIPFVGVSLVIFMIALTGLPPTAGFIGKLYLFAAVLDAAQESNVFLWLAVIGALNSVISLYYYARVMRNVFLRDGDSAGKTFTLTAGENVTIMLMLIPTLLFGVYFSPIVSAAFSAVKMFIQP